MLQLCLTRTLRIVIINDQDKTEKINIDRVKDKKIFEQLILLIERYKIPAVKGGVVVGMEDK